MAERRAGAAGRGRRAVLLPARWCAVTGSWPSGRPPERPPAATARALADLARAGHQVLDEPSMQVEFEIHHGVDRPGALADTMAALPDDRLFAETLSSASNGAGLVVGTRVGEYRAAGRPVSTARGCTSRSRRSRARSSAGRSGRTSRSGTSPPRCSKGSSPSRTSRGRCCSGTVSRYSTRCGTSRRPRCTRAMHHC